MLYQNNIIITINLHTWLFISDCVFCVGRNIALILVKHQISMHIVAHSLLSVACAIWQQGTVVAQCSVCNFPNIVFDAAGCDNGFTCVSGVCIAPTVAPAPAPAMQPQIGSTSGPSMTPAGTSKATPAATAASVFSTATIVPAITLVATLSDYATVAAFNTTEQTRVRFTAEHIFINLTHALCCVSFTLVKFSVLS